MEIQYEPEYKKGQTFHAITEDDYLVYMDELSLKDLHKMAKQWGEEIYWCCQYPSGTVIERVV